MPLKGIDDTIRVAMYGGSAVPSTATYSAHVRETVTSAAILLDLNTAAGTIEWISSVANPAPIVPVGQEFITTLVLKFNGNITETLTDNNNDVPGRTDTILDIVRTDLTPDQYQGFKLYVAFDTIVTRLP